MRLVVTVLALVLFLAVSTMARADEPELANEIVAQVNNDIVTRTDYSSALEGFREELKRSMQGKSDAEIDTELDTLKTVVLDYLIDGLLLEQKAKKLAIDVEAEVNQRMSQIATESGFKDVRELETAMRAQGIDPDEARLTLRKQFQQQYVLQREVLQPMGRRPTNEEFEAARKQYLTKLRQDAFIKIAII